VSDSWIPYGRQSVDESDREAVQEVLQGDWLTQGPAVPDFEEAVATRVGANHAVAFSSATAALHGAATVAGFGPGDRVATSPLTFMASANCIRYVDADPVLVDVDPATLNLDPTAVPADASGLVAVHYAGLPVELSDLPDRPPVVIEDGAHALGSRSTDGAVGGCQRSDMTVFSFHPVKPITTGEGGMVTTNSGELADGLRRFRNHGIVRRSDVAPWYYEVVDRGFNYRMTDLQAALGRSQLRRLDQFIERRNDLADRYRDLLSDLPLTLPPTASGSAVHSYHLFPIRVDDRRRVFDGLHAAGIGVQVHYVPVHHHPVSTDLGLSPGDLPECDRAYDRLLSLPIHPNLTGGEQDRVVSALRALL